MLTADEWQKPQNRALYGSFTIALAFHALLLGILKPDLRFHALSKSTEIKSLEVQLSKAKPESEVEPKIEPQASENPPPTPKEHTASETLETTLKPVVTKEISTVAIFNGPVLQKWLQGETESHIKSNAQPLESFRQTFIPKTIEKPADDRLENISPLATGLNTMTVNGKRICKLRMATPHHDDWARDIVTYKDCSPPEKFEFKMR